MRRLLTRIRRDERFRFLVVGGINTALGYALYTVFVLWVFANIPFGYVVSLVVSYAIAITVAFVLYRRFVFHVTGHIVRDYLRFVGVYLVSIAINVVTLPLLVEVLHISPLLAQAVVLCVTTLLSFLGHKNFSFRRPRGVQPTDGSL